MKILLILAIVVFVSSCSSSGKIVDKTYYRFPTVAHEPINKPFIVENPTAIGILGNRPMVAEVTTGGLIQMSHNFWIDSPKLLLYNYLNKVFTTKESTHKPSKLYTKILNIEKKGNSSILSINFTITANNGETLFNKTYLYVETLTQNDIPTFVKSLLKSLDKLVQEFVNDSA